MSVPETKKRISIADLYPQLSLEEQQEAERNLRDYLRVVSEIFEYIKIHNPKVLTELTRRAKFRKERRITKRIFPS